MTIQVALGSAPDGFTEKPSDTPGVLNRRLWADLSRLKTFLERNCQITGASRGDAPTTHRTRFRWEADIAGASR
ncbi:hypothetical protein [Amycolatopsis sp. cmx-8-4]|uniref:hypothetical protein n=1 Tax=Amycolatopsis sp. cmx-8-4 TaxID=2790947 RepID=UPI00397C2B86